jgi:hypothetical protein
MIEGQKRLLASIDKAETPFYLRQPIADRMFLLLERAKSPILGPRLSLSYCFSENLLVAGVGFEPTTFRL